MLQRLARLPLVLALLAALAHPAPAADSTTLSFGSLTLSLGMAEQDALEALRSYHVAKATNPKDKATYFNVYDRIGGECLGGLATSDGKVSFLFKYWHKASAEDAVRLVRNLYNVAEKLQKEQGAPCGVSAEELNGPGYESRSLVFRCGPRSATLNFYQTKEKAEVSLREDVVLK